MAAFGIPVELENIAAPPSAVVNAYSPSQAFEKLRQKANEQHVANFGVNTLAKGVATDWQPGVASAVERVYQEHKMIRGEPPADLSIKKIPTDLQWKRGWSKGV